MKKGFTLLELIVVIVIIGILATLGFSQYTRMIERSRGAEARQVLGALRILSAGLWVEHNVGGVVPAGTITNPILGIGNVAGQIAACPCTAAAPSTSYYFCYSSPQNAAGTGIDAIATRCTGVNGKQPGGPVAGSTLTLTSVFSTGADTWGGSGGY